MEKVKNVNFLIKEIKKNIPVYGLSQLKRNYKIDDQDIMDFANRDYDFKVLMQKRYNYNFDVKEKESVSKKQNQPQPSQDKAREEAKAKGE